LKIITAYDLGAEIARRQVASVKTASDLGAIAAVKQASAGTPPKPEVPQPEMPPRPKPNQTPQDRRRDLGGFDPPQPKPPTPPQPRPPVPGAGAPPAPQPKPGSLMDVTHDDFDSIPGMHIRRTTRTPATPEIIAREQARRAFEAHPEYPEFVKFQRQQAGGDRMQAGGNQTQPAPAVNPLRAQAMARDAESEPAFRAAIARGDNFVEFPSQFGGPPVRVPISAQNRRAFGPNAAAAIGALTGGAAAGLMPQQTQPIGINNNPAASRLKPHIPQAQGGLPQMPAGLDAATRQKEIADQRTRDAYGLAPNTPIAPETERELREAHGEGHTALTHARMNPSPQGFNAAIAGFEKYTKLAPQDPMGWQQLGVSMFERAQLLPQGSQERENLLTEATQAVRKGVAFGMNDANGNPIDPRELQGKRFEKIQAGPARNFLNEVTGSVRRSDVDSILGRQRPQPGQPAPQGQPGQPPAPAVQEQPPAPELKLENSFLPPGMTLEQLDEEPSKPENPFPFLPPGITPEQAGILSPEQEQKNVEIAKRKEQEKIENARQNLKFDSPEPAPDRTQPPRLPMAPEPINAAEDFNPEAQQQMNNTLDTIPKQPKNSLVFGAPPKPALPDSSAQSKREDKLREFMGETLHPRPTARIRSVNGDVFFNRPAEEQETNPDATREDAGSWDYRAEDENQRNNQNRRVPLGYGENITRRVPGGGEDFFREQRPSLSQTRKPSPLSDSILPPPPPADFYDSLLEGNYGSSPEGELSIEQQVLQTQTQEARRRAQEAQQQAFDQKRRDFAFESPESEPPAGAAPPPPPQEEAPPPAAPQSQPQYAPPQYQPRYAPPQYVPPQPQQRRGLFGRRR